MYGQTDILKLQTIFAAGDSATLYAELQKTISGESCRDGPRNRE